MDSGRVTSNVPQSYAHSSSCWGLQESLLSLVGKGWSLVHLKCLHIDRANFWGLVFAFEKEKKNKKQVYKQANKYTKNEKQFPESPVVCYLQCIIRCLGDGEVGRASLGVFQAACHRTFDSWEVCSVLAVEEVSYNNRCSQKFNELWMMNSELQCSWQPLLGSSQWFFNPEVSGDRLQHFWDISGSGHRLDTAKRQGVTSFSVVKALCKVVTSWALVHNLVTTKNWTCTKFVKITDHTSLWDSTSSS